MFVFVMMVCASSSSAQSVVGSFEKEGVSISLLFDGRWGVVDKGEIECGDMPHLYVCIEQATKFSEVEKLAPLDVDLRGHAFADAGVFAGRTWGASSGNHIEIARRFAGELSSGYKVPTDHVRLLSTETGTVGNSLFFRFEFLSDLENGPLWSTITRIKNGSRTVDVGTHVFGEIWTISPEMLAVRKDFHNRLIKNLPQGWVNE
ncbi:hypothetical protein [Ruegeria sp. A3M17]|uniref:hypothetical protein n=1 Tax=Ruegeria sp. A3M17 TaxID=2267229 RepID=UPI0011BF898C|nr:hypothetical protein [Ruegeria sp. A3M17]